MSFVFYDSNLLPAAHVEHCYKNCWIRDLYYIGICGNEEVKNKLWDGMIDVLDTYRWKLAHHAKIKPDSWFEYMHVRYSPEGTEIDEGWRHKQWDAIGNWLEVCIDHNRIDLASLMVDYLEKVQYFRNPAAGAWEDRNAIDSYSISSCIYALSKAKPFLESQKDKIDLMVKMGLRRLYGMLPYASPDKIICLSLLGVIWPFDMAGPYKQEIIGLAKTHLMREPFGFIRYVGDTYDGEFMSRKKGNELPWLLGDLFMAKIEPKNQLWKDRIKKAHDTFGCMPEAYFPETMKPNRNSPLLWAEAMHENI